MTTTNKRHKHSFSKQYSRETLQTVNNNDLYDLVTDHNLIAPNEICQNTIGLLSVIDKCVIDMSFSKLYQLSLKCGWEKIFTQEQQKLKPNDISVSKCFVLNRLLYECLKNPNEFGQKIKAYYEAIKSRMLREFPPWTSRDLFYEVRRWQDMQCRRRLFYFNHSELEKFPSILMLQKASTNWCHCLIQYSQRNKTFWETEGRTRFKEHFQHSFIIVAQPTGSDGAAVTQYIKNASGHFARLNTRIICLLDPDILKDDIELSDINVTLYPLNRDANDKAENQPSIHWEIRKVMSTEGDIVSIYCAEVHTLQLGKIDSVCKRLSLNSTLCQLELRMKIKIKDPEFEENIVLITQPFGICSHAQYFPKFVAQIFLYEMKQILNDNKQVTDPDIITEFVGRYHTRMIGVKPTDHTYRYIRSIFAKAIDDVKTTRTNNSFDSSYEDILAKIISQIDIMLLYPVLSLMYEDKLFLGICNSADVDSMLCGSREQPHLLLRFNNLMDHQWNSNAIVQFIIHDGTLRKASFDMRTFANEMCRFISESIGDKTKQAIVLSTMLPRSFTDFQLYFHEELYRLNKMSPPSDDVYDPLLPVLWMTMRENINDDMMHTNSTFRNITHKRKRNRSNSFPTIESITSESPTNTKNIAVYINQRDDGSIELNNISTDFHSFPLPNSTSNKLAETMEKTCQSNDQGTISKSQQLLIEVPGNLDISPAVIFRYLGEHLSNITDHQNEAATPNYFIRSNQSKISLYAESDSNYSKGTNSPVDYYSDNRNSLSEISKVNSNLLIDVIHNETTNEPTIKHEPHDVDYVILENKHPT